MSDTGQDTTTTRVTSIDVLAEMIATLQIMQERMVSQVLPTQPAITEEERGLLLVLRLKNPTQRAVAKAMGYKNHNSLKKFPAVLEAIRRFQMMKTVTRGTGRSIVDHTLADDSEY